MASNFDLNTENEDKQKEHLITIAYTNKKCKKIPAIEGGEDYFTFYSPKGFTLNPRESCIVNLHFNISSTTTQIDPWISLLPSLKNCGLKVISRTVNRKNEIELMLENISYHYTVEIKKRQVLGSIFLLGFHSKDMNMLKTEYYCIYD